MKHTLPTLILMLLMAGCASLSDRGAVTQSDYVMPDGTTMTMWDRTKVNLFVPSTQHIMVYKDGNKTSQPDYTKQDGFAPGLMEATIEAAGLGVGLSQSGDRNSSSTTTTVDGGTVSATGVGLGVAGAQVVGGNGGAATTNTEPRRRRGKRRD